MVTLNSITRDFNYICKNPTTEHYLTKRVPHNIGLNQVMGTAYTPEEELNTKVWLNGDYPRIGHKIYMVLNGDS